MVCPAITARAVALLDERVRVDHDLRQAVERRLAERVAEARRRRALRERARAEKQERRDAGLRARHAAKLDRSETSMSDELRAAMGRLTTAERQKLAVRWTRNAEHWEAAGSQLGPMWYALAALVLEVDRLEQARAAAGGGPHVMRHARPARK